MIAKLKGVLRAINFYEHKNIFWLNIYPYVNKNTLSDGTGEKSFGRGFLGEKFRQGGSLSPKPPRMYKEYEPTTVDIFMNQHNFKQRGSRVDI